MDTMLTVTEASRNFADVVNRAYYRGESTTLLKNGRPVARIIPSGRTLRTGKEIAARMNADRPRLTPKDAESMANEIKAARTKLRKPTSPWA